MSHPSIRVVALAVIRHPVTKALLVFQAHDPSRGLTYHRPLGGGVEFNEKAEDTVVRELLEEIGVTVEPLRLLGAAESLFVLRGEPRHEIALLIECRFADASLYDRKVFTDLEGKGEDGFWRAVDDGTPLFPEALSAVLADC
jgi:ADP-ribose pyrophosphatase YjhB (NUDIX family)